MPEHHDPDPWQRHETDQILHFARNTTPDQRYRWLVEMFLLLHPEMRPVAEAHDRILRQRRESCKTNAQIANAPQHEPRA